MVDHSNLNEHSRKCSSSSWKNIKILIVDREYYSLHVTCNMVITKLHTCVKLVGGLAYVMIKKEKNSYNFPAFLLLCL
jgi:hypothetical protein